jgi:type VI secretion system secreted protein VgrG
VIEQARLSLAGLDGAVTRVAGREALNELSRFTVELLAPERVDTESLLDRDALLALHDPAGETALLPLWIRRVSHLGHFRGKERYSLELLPPFARLLWRVSHEIFQDKTTQEIVTFVLSRAGFQGETVKWRLAGKYAKRVYTVQHGESDWAFVTRLLADEGINFWLDAEDERALLVLGDHPSSHDGLTGDSSVVPFHDPSGRAGTSFAFHAMTRSYGIASTRVALRDVDVQNPAAPVDGEAGSGALEVFEYPSNLVIPEAATARAAVRLQQLRRHQTTVRADSANTRIRPGRVVETWGAAEACFSGKFLIVAVEHGVTQASQDEGRAVPYRSQATLCPWGDTPYRPAIPSTRPTIEGLEPAIVTGPPGEEIHTDDLGRIKVRFFWDRSGIADDKSSRWIRTLQLNLVSPQVLPRVGWEVPIVYENGHPDRPFVLGRLYNGGAPPPYGLPGKQATSTLQSSTSPSDGTTQELRLGDDAGSEEVFIHATRDQSVSVGGSQKTTVAANRSDDVQKTQTLAVDAAQTTSVGGNQKVTVGADGTVAVKGARAETVGGNETVGVTGTYAVTVSGAYTETVGAVYSLRCNQANATIQGAFTQVVGGPLSTTAGLGSNHSVAGARTEVVGGARSFVAGATYADGTTGVKRITAGAAKESAGADMAFGAGASMTLQAGGVLSLEGGGKVVFEAPAITVKAATLSANGGSSMKLAGALKASSTVKLDAPSVKKTKTVKVQG